MKKLSTPRAILFGMGLIALAIVSLPYSSKYISNAEASNGLTKRDIQRVLNNCSPMINGTLIHMNC